VCIPCAGSGGFDQSELLQRSHAVIETDFFDDHAVIEFQNRRSGEVRSKSRSRYKIGTTFFEAKNDSEGLVHPTDAGPGSTGCAPSLRFFDRRNAAGRSLGSFWFRSLARECPSTSSSSQVLLGRGHVK
jgi:hypothetical protein